MTGNLRRKPQLQNGGFTLLEILVALSICALALSVGFQLFASGMRNITTSEDHVYADIKAFAKVKEILQDENLTDRSWTEATNDGYLLNITVGEHFAERMAELPVKLMEIRVLIRWGKGNKTYSHEVSSLKLIKRGCPS